MDSSIVIVYATWHGQAEKVARRIADVFSACGVQSRLINVRRAETDGTAVDRFDAAIAVGSVHFGRHPRRLVEFIRRHSTTFSSKPSAFVSISGAAASPEGEAEARRYMHEFTIRTGWQPDVTLSAAGAIPYSRYGFFTRLIMQFTSRIAGRDSDASRDYEYTNWRAVDQFAHGFIDELGVHQWHGVASP